MKKLLLSAFTLSQILLVNQQVNAQTTETITFESFNLAADTFYNGSDAAGNFTVQNSTFDNYYDVTYDYWVGFAVSNVVDVTTPGYGNQYAAYSGSGFNSSNYGVYYLDGKINFTDGVLLDSLKITNTTFAALSMLNGDFYAKQFGSVNGADGNPDGTNGEDFFIVYIYALDELNNILDTFEVALADYRFANNSLDYILDTWLNVDFTSLTDTVYALDFAFASSDTSSFGINTPTYFAMDNLTYRKLPSTAGIEETNISNIVLYPNPAENILNVKNFSGAFQILDFTGRTILKGNTIYGNAIDLASLENGTYYFVSGEDVKAQIFVVKR